MRGTISKRLRRSIPNSKQTNDVRAYGRNGSTVVCTGGRAKYLQAKAEYKALRRGW